MLEFPTNFGQGETILKKNVGNLQITLDLLTSKLYTERNKKFIKWIFGKEFIKWIFGHKIVEVNT